MHVPYLSVKRNVAPSTQSVALNALVFPYQHIINRPIGDISQFRRAKREPRLPIVLTTDEIALLLNQLNGTQWLIAALMYGSGLRRVELVRLRVKDIDLDHLQIRV